MLAFAIAIYDAVRTMRQRFDQSGLRFMILSFLLLIVVGTGVYRWLEGWSLFEALYVTIITITTVGYGDLSPQTPEGRLFAIFFTLVAIGLAGYALSSLAATLFEGQVLKRQRLKLENRMRKMNQLKGHVIVCGGTVLGHRVTNEFLNRGTQFVIIEENEEKLKWALLWMNKAYINKRQRHYRAELVDFSSEESKSAEQLAEEMDVLYILGDPTDEQHLRHAGIERALGLVTAMPDDRDNMAIILSARDICMKLNHPNLRILSGAADAIQMRRIYLAGANKVFSPDMMAGFTAASYMLDPNTGDLWQQMLFDTDLAIRFHDMTLAEYPHLVGKTTHELKQALNQLVIAIKRDGTTLYAPDPDDILQTDDTLIVMGTVL